MVAHPRTARVGGHARPTGVDRKGSTMSSTFVATIRANLATDALVVAAALAGGVGTYTAIATTACAEESATSTHTGTNRFGCIWWAGIQGNGHGRTVWNR